MLVVELFAIFNEFSQGDTWDKKVHSLCNDSRKVVPGSVYVAISGTDLDGHDFIDQAIQAGAIGIVAEDMSKIPASYTGAKVQVENSREVLALLSHNFYGRPSRDLLCYAVTGTNGKTSTAYMLEYLLNQQGLPTGVMGTIDHHLGDKVWKSSLTTPDVIDVQRRLREFIDEGAKATVMEVSSHALDQKRVDQVAFDVCIFTNLSRDHLDYHKNMEDYFKAKEQLFSKLPRRKPQRDLLAILNIDDPYSKKIKCSPLMKVKTFGQSKEADFCFHSLKYDFSGTRFKLKTKDQEVDMRVSVPGLYSVYNAVGSVVAAMHSGMSLQKAVSSFSSFKGIPGRLEPVENEKGLHVFVDYAHSDQALESVLGSLKKIQESSAPQAQIITVFGCGGDRDQGKRSLMGDVALKLSDHIIVTSDNPRTEEPKKIIDEICKNFPQSSAKYEKEVGRKEALRKAVTRANSGDVILVAGKGHEPYQIIGTEKIDFNDSQLLKEFLDVL